MKKTVGISLTWGAIAAAIGIGIDLLRRYVVAEAYNGLRQVLAIASLVITIVLVYKTIKTYRSRLNEDTFTSLQAFGSGALMTIVYALLMALYLVVLSQCIDKDMIAKHKAKQIALIEQSDISAQEQIQKIENIEDAGLFAIVVGNFLQNMIFPLMAALFCAALMQKRPAPIVNNNIENTKKEE